MYAHCISFEIEARNLKEAKEKAKVIAIKKIDCQVAEYQEMIIDKPINLTSK